MNELTRTERLKAMALPEPNYWMGAACILGFFVTLYLARRFEARYRMLAAESNERRQAWLDAQRLILWGAVVYFSFVAFWALLAFGMKFLLSIAWWGYVLIGTTIAVGYLRGWFPGWSLADRRRRRRPDDEVPPP